MPDGSPGDCRVTVIPLVLAAAAPGVQGPGLGAQGPGLGVGVATGRRGGRGEPQLRTWL